jgi:hypothetical protein
MGKENLHVSDGWGSSPWRPASLPFTFFDDTPYNLTVRWFHGCPVTHCFFTLRIPTRSQFLHTRSFCPPTTHSIQPHFPCRGGCPGCFFQHSVTGARHSRRFVTRYFFVICNFLPDPILSVGHSGGVVARVHGRALGFFQHPRPSP